MKSQKENNTRAKWTTKKGKASEVKALAMAVEIEKADDLLESGIVIYVRPVGRPPLGNAGTSPQIIFRVPRETREKDERLAASEGVSASELARQALEEFISRAG